MRSKFLPLTRRAYYTNNFQGLVQQIRAFSSKVSNLAGAPTEQKVFLGPRDFRTPLPGNVGTAQFFLTCTSMPSQRPQQASPLDASVLSPLFSADPVVEEKQNVLSMLLSGAFEESHEQAVFSVSISNLLECVAQDCPVLLKRDLACLFPNKDLGSHNLTVLTLCQKTENDMSSWSESTELERDQLMEHFVTAAQEICDYLSTCGYWADFIDPSSGRPFNGPYTTATFFETDERYRQLGFRVEDLGCCKVITHKLWGTHAFVGSVFTDAPLESPEVRDVLERHQQL